MLWFEESHNQSLSWWIQYKPEDLNTLLLMHLGPWKPACPACLQHLFAILEIRKKKLGQVPAINEIGTWNFPRKRFGQLALFCSWTELQLINCLNSLFGIVPIFHFLFSFSKRDKKIVWLTVLWRIFQKQFFFFFPRKGAQKMSSNSWNLFLLKKNDYNMKRGMFHFSRQSEKFFATIQNFFSKMAAKQGK